MAQQLINHGTTPGDGTGESPFTGMQKVNANFTELYGLLTAANANIALKAPIASPTFTGTVGGITKAMVGLGNVDNTPDASKPVSTTQQTAINAGDKLRLKTGDVLVDFVASGLVTPTDTDLTVTMTAGVAYVDGSRVEKTIGESDLTFTYLATRDTYVDIDDAGVISRTAVVNGAAAPSLAGGSLRLEKVVTDGTKVASVTRLAVTGKLVVAQTNANGNTVLVGADGSMSVNDVGLHGASPSASAAVNTSAIQSALDAAGIVTVTTPGVYLISTTLLIGSNTELRLAPGVEIKASGSGVGNLLNSSVMSATKSSVTLTYTANSLLVTVNWTAHGLTTADSVWITGADQYYYLGVFPVVSVTNANAFVIKLRRQPLTAATGTILAVRAQVNTKISGGIWNFNYSGGNAPATATLTHAIRMGGVNNLSFENITGKDTMKYVLDIGGVANFRFSGGSGSGLNADYLKLRGPLFDAQVNNVDVSTGDDILSIQTVEPAAFANYNWTWGDCIGVKLSGIGGQSATAGIVIYPTNADGFIDGVQIDGFTGTMATNPHIRVDNNGTGTGNLGVLTINNPVFSGPNTALYLKGTLAIDSIVMVNPKHNAVNNQGRMLFLEANTINAKVKVIGGDFSKCESLLNTTAIGGTLRLELDNVTVSGSSWNTFSIGGAGTNYLRLRNMVFAVNPGNAMFNISGASSPALYVDADNITNPSGNHVVATTGTPTLVTQNKGFKCDHAVFTPAPNSITYNTNAAYGTGAGVYATGAGASVRLA